MGSANKLLTGVAALCAAAGTAAGAPIAEGQAQWWSKVAGREARRLTSCESTASDLVGETALRFLRRHRDRFGDDTEVNARYVRQAIRNAYRDHLARARRTRPESDLLDDDSLEVSTVVHAGVELETGLGGAVLEEFRSDLRPFDQRVLDLLEAGHKDRQIAAILGETRHQIRASVARLRRAAARSFDVVHPEPAPLQS